MIDYKTFMKHAAKVVATAPEGRSVLQGILHKSDGSLVVTDGFRLYIAKDVHSRREDVILSPKGEVIQGKYPDISRLIPNEYRQQIEVSTQKLIKYLDCIYSPAKLLDDKVIVKFKDKKISSYMPTHYKAEIQVPFSFLEPVSFNAKFLLDTLKLFWAADEQVVIFGFNGHMRPLTIENEDKSLLAIVMPVRTI